MQKKSEDEKTLFDGDDDLFKRYLKNVTYTLNMVLVTQLLAVAFLV